MHIIYKINFPNNKVYIGQTKDLHKRIQDHLSEARTGNNSKVYRAMRKYQITKDNFEIIEENILTIIESNQREMYWIAYYNSYNNGYNSTIGGDISTINNRGENAKRAILTNSEVVELRKIRAKMVYSKDQVFAMYKDRISFGAFTKIWNYATYKEVGQEYNLPEVTEFYRRTKKKGVEHIGSLFTAEQVKAIRHEYYIDAVSSKDLCVKYKCTLSCIQRIVANDTYKDVSTPSPSFLFRRTRHIFTKLEIDNFIENFIQSKLSIKNYWKKIKDDSTNLFSYYGESSFRKFVYKELSERNYQYKSINNREFEIIKIN